MANVEERLAKVEREIELLREQHKKWPISQVDEKYKGDEVLEEIFRLGREERDKERKRDQDQILYLFDTDHWTILQLRKGPQYEALLARMNEVGRGLCFTSIVTFYEVMNGWLKYIASPKSQSAVVNAQVRFEALLDAFSSSELLPFSEKAAEQFTKLRSEGCRIGLMDLRIASIGLTHGMIVVTRNTVDFGRVPGLELQDWFA